MPRCSPSPVDGCVLPSPPPLSSVKEAEYEYLAHHKANRISADAIMVRRQQIFAWQTFGMQGNDQSSGETGEKRQRDTGNAPQLPAKRQHVFVDSSAHDNPAMYRAPTPQPPPPKRTRQPLVIDLLDDDCDGSNSRTPLQAQPGTQGNPLHLDSLPTPDFKHLVATFTNPAASNGTVEDIVPIVEPPLDKEQHELVDLIMSGRNVFYTGSAGTGKSTVLKAFVKRFAARGMKVNITAPTGRAALDINGSTTWTYAGWTPDAHKKPLAELRAGARGKFVRQRLQETDVLVMDEISMVENHHFERINHLMKEARGSEAAFGGVQIIVTGDFCQLPPVKPFKFCIDCGKETIKNQDESEYRCRAHGTYKDIDKWAFRSKAWEECNFAHVNLARIHRQSDRAFINILNKLRMGIRLLPIEVDLLLNHESETRNAIQLFATRAEVNRVNEERFRALRSIERKYQSLDHFKWNEAHGNLKKKGEVKNLDGSLQALNEHRFESQIRLKKGMLVVLLHNLDIGAGLVNGSQGVIQGFEEYDPKKLPKAATGRELRDGFTVGGGQILQGDHAVFREWQLQEYASQMEYKAWPIVRYVTTTRRASRSAKLTALCLQILEWCSEDNLCRMYGQSAWRYCSLQSVIEDPDSSNGSMGHDRSQVSGYDVEPSRCRSLQVVRTGSSIRST